MGAALSRRGAVAGITVILLLAGAVGSQATVAAGSQSDLCPLLFPSLAGPTLCYRPSQLKAADRHMPVRPVDPRSAVWRLTHLPLTTVAVGQAYGKAVWIAYLFGTVAPDARGLPDLSARGSNFVMVSESVTQLHQSGIRITRDTGESGRPGVPPRVVRGPWILQVNMPKRKLVLGVDSYRSRAIVLRIGLAILGAGQARKSATGGQTSE